MIWPDLEIDRALRAGWTSACKLYEHLAAGGTLMPLPLGTLRLPQGEIRFGDGMLGYARCYGAHTPDPHGPALLPRPAAPVSPGLGDEYSVSAAVRLAADVVASMRWHDHATVRVALTNKRMMWDISGAWHSFRHDRIVEFTADLARWAFVLRHEQRNPLLLYGAGAPWFAVAMAVLLFGPEGLTLPVLEPVAKSVEQRRAAIKALITRQKTTTTETQPLPIDQHRLLTPPIE